MKAWQLMVGLAVAGPAVATNPVLESRVISAGLFKNGLAVIHREVDVPGPGTYTVMDLPDPTHGTLWIESEATVIARSALRELSRPLDAVSAVPTAETLAGKMVNIHLADRDQPPVSGRVVRLEPPRGADAWSRSYAETASRWGYSASVLPKPASSRFLVVQTTTGRTYIDLDRVAMLEELFAGEQQGVIQHQPVLELEVSQAATVAISYLSKGLSWSPSYRVDISNPARLKLEQQAVIRNELGDLADTPLSLISGFPSIQFAHVTSPFSLRTTWQQFFTELNQAPRPGPSGGGQILTQNVVVMNTPAREGGPDLSAIPAGEGVDLHYEAIGRHTLREGDALMVKVADAEAPYARIVEWIIPDTRIADGRFVQDYERQQDPERYQDAAWDALRFENPLPFPMTTAPAVVVSDGRFNGQRVCHWVNPGEETTLQITRALSLRTHHVEYEEPDTRELVRIGGDAYRQATVRGLVRANNHRKEPITLVIQRQFSGDLVAADGDPEVDLLEEGVYSINKRNRLAWEVPLAPGAEVEYTYRYQVLVRH